MNRWRWGGGMTEAEWLACGDPDAMFAFLRRKKSVRKQRLFASACCRLIWDQVPRAWRLAVMVSERYADGRATRDELAACARVAVRDAGWQTPAMQAAGFACNTSHPVSELASCAAYQVAVAAPGSKAQQAGLLRD